MGGQAENDSERLYTLYRRGVELLADGSAGEATVPLAEVARSEPEKASVREALGRAYFRNRQYEEAATEFEAVVDRQPVNDYAHFCLGRSLENSGRRHQAKHHAALAAHMRPDRKDYRELRERLRVA